jgi:hypothetical protein
MGRKSNNKRKERNSSGNESVNLNNRKIPKQRGPSSEKQTSDTSFSVSDLLGLTNSVLYGGEDSDLTNTSVFLNNHEPCNSPKDTIMAGAQPTLQDVMSALGVISGRLTSVEQKLQCLDNMDLRMAKIEKDMNTLWLALEDKVKRVDERVSRLEHITEGADIAAAQVTSRIDELERERDSLRDDLVYMKSQSMRNNLVFTGVPEVDKESPEITESLLRKHINEALNIAKETADAIKFERVHRSPGEPTRGKTRSIIAKFSFFKDKEVVRRQWKHLDGTGFNVFEQFPPEVVAKRRKLLPKMKAERAKGKRSWIAYDTLYVDGRPVRD